MFKGHQIDQDLNNTLIFLLIKTAQPKEILQSRPINLCTVLYKLIMKIIVNRFKLVFPKITSQEQAEFIAGRNILDNIIIAQEVIHSMQGKGKKWMALKIDLKKAYDRIRWDFTDKFIQATEIPEYLRKVICLL